MTNKDFPGAQSQDSKKETKKMRDAASEVFSKTSDMARDAGEKLNARQRTRRRPCRITSGEFSTNSSEQE